MNDPILNPPGIVKAYDAELDQLAFQIRSALDNADQAAKRGAEHYKAAGKLLSRAREKVPGHQWQKWVFNNVKRSDRQVRRWMALARIEGEDDLDEQWRIISGNKDEDGAKTDVTSVNPPIEEEIRPPKPETPGQSLFCDRCQQLNDRVTDCPECERIRIEAKGGKTRPPDGGQNEPGEDWDEDDQPQDERTRTGADDHEDKPRKPPKPLALCDRCRRVGVQKDCIYCQELRGGKGGKPAKKGITSANGVEVPSEHAWKAAIGVLQRMVDQWAHLDRTALNRQGAVAQTPEWEGLNRLFRQLREDGIDYMKNRLKAQKLQAKETV